MCFKTPTIPQPQQITTTARDLVPYTKAPVPDAPIFGGQNTSVVNKGIKTLKIKKGGDE